jgi:hypothetical protein
MSAPHASKLEAQADDRARSTLRTVLRHALIINAPLTFVALAMAPLALIALIDIFADPRMITGVPAWIKPLKFAISTAIYAFTLLYLLTFVHGHQRLVQLIGTLSALGLGVELTLIPLQVLRGTTSHFNESTPFDAAVFKIMGGFVVLVFLMILVLTVLLLRQRQGDPAWSWVLRLGLIGAVVGMSVAILMVFPTAQELASHTATGQLPIVGGHTVGAADGGPGLPFVGWSTLHGDLRVPHFFGLHTLQIMLVLGWLLSQTPLTVAQRSGIVVTSGLGLLGITLLLTWQALRGQSLIAPDGLTLAAGGALVATVALGTAMILIMGGRRRESIAQPV